MRGIGFQASNNHSGSRRQTPPRKDWGTLRAGTICRETSVATITQPDPIADLLRRAKTIAVVGLSESPFRPSHGVSAYMQSHGYRIIPVNPQIQEVLGEKSYSSLLSINEKVDIVNIFRRPEFVDEIVEQAIQLTVPAIWMQEDVVNEPAAERARRAGIFVVMDRCILKEHRARMAG